LSAVLMPLCPVSGARTDLAEISARSPTTGKAAEMLDVNRQTVVNAKKVYPHWRRCQLLIALAAGVAAMIEKLVRGFVIVALMIMVILSYAQKHEGCLRGRSLETFQPCGSVGVDM
jgi:hypothetical protein